MVLVRSTAMTTTSRGPCSSAPLKWRPVIGLIAEAASPVASATTFWRQGRWDCHDSGVEILSSRILRRPADPDQSRRFYRDVLGLAVYREFGSAADPGVVFFLGAGLLEVSGRATGAGEGPVMIWLQVRDVHAEHDRLAVAGVRALREPMTEPWGLIEMWIEDPDRVRIVLVEVPADHLLRRDSRSLPAPA